MIDIHCHLLPGFDDGAATLDEALALARVAVADGISGCVLTPHIHPGRWENEARDIARATADFAAALEEHGIPLQLQYAAEVRLTDLIFTQLETAVLPFLGQFEGESLLLLEFPHGHVIPGSDQLVQWLRRRGIRSVLAHPERNRSIMREPALLKPFFDAGCLLQVTAASLTGGFGEAAERVALQLLDADQITFVASDAHNLKSRPPQLSRARALVAARKGEQTAQQLFEDNQRRYLQFGQLEALHG
jgi:protein-tyrosine phosphatase